MTHNTYISKPFLKWVTAIGLACLCSCSTPEEKDDSEYLNLDDIAVQIAPGQSREYSYTDKRGGFYYGMTSTDNFSNWYAGWNVNAKRIMADYRIYVDGEPLNREEAEISVFPDRLERKYRNATEIFSMADSPRLLCIRITDVDGKTIGIEALGDNIGKPTFENGSLTYLAKEAPGTEIMLCPIKTSNTTFANGIFETDANAGGFIIAYGTADECQAAIEDFRNNGDKLLAGRHERMQQLLCQNYTHSNNPDLDNSIAWIMLTNDALITEQHGGYGMYAGLPWFTDFWGRDMFISMPGAVLCTGQFDTARNILSSFARFQDRDSTSSTYGRVPNRLNLDGVLYNTTDGTPRFVMQVMDYLKYTGDSDFVKEIYPAVKIATDASLKLYTDENGYLTHADADTWMDAKRQGKYPCSPRGNRAVDVQALWYRQLTDAADMAELTNQTTDAERWRSEAKQLQANFERDFTDRTTSSIYDHLNTDGSPDTQFRPNGLYALDMITDTVLSMHETRKVWERLVYPWGVSSLDQDDEQFHPYHEQWHRYHKDDAYHNGTIWLWNNGMAMQRMLENGQTEQAYALLRNMNRQALDEGAVGSLSENADAWPLPGSTWVRRSGTFLQAWSNSEHIRVWNQYFLGVRPDMMHRLITLQPQFPKELTEVQSRMAIGDGSLTMRISQTDTDSTYCYRWSGNPVTLRLEIGTYESLDVPMTKGCRLTAQTNGKTLSVAVREASGKAIGSYEALPSSYKTELKNIRDTYFEGVDFAKPSYRENLKSMSRYFDPPLHYGSVE